MILYKSYKDMTDKEIVDLIIAGNEEAMLYLLYDRYESDLKFFMRGDITIRWHILKI